MKIFKNFKLEKCVSDDENRPALHHVYVERKRGDAGFAYASKNTVLVKVPVILEEDDKPGAVSIPAIKMAKAYAVDQEHIILGLGNKVSVKTNEISSEFDRFNHLTSPKFESVFPKTKAKSFFAVNVKLLSLAAAAMDTDVLFIEVRDPRSPLICRRNDSSAAIAAVAPVEIDRPVDEGQEDLFENKNQKSKSEKE